MTKEQLKHLQEKMRWLDKEFSLHKLSIDVLMQIVAECEKRSVLTGYLFANKLESPDWLEAEFNKCNANFYALRSLSESIAKVSDIAKTEQAA